MKKTASIGGALAALIICTVTSFALENNTQDFKYMVGSDCVYFSGEIQSMGENDVFFGIYDNGVLIELDKHSSDENFESVRVPLSYIPKNIEVKSFMWSSDGKMAPLTVREDPEQEYNIVKIDTNMILENSDSMYKDKKISICIDETLNTRVTYQLDDNFKLFVNNAEVTDISDEIMIKYLTENRYISADLIDTDNDEVYEYVYTSCYETAVVDYTLEAASYNEINFKAYSPYIGSDFKIDTSSDVKVTITKNDEPIRFDQIKENDVLSIAYDVTGDFKDSSFYDIIVSDTVIDGMVEWRDSVSQTVKIEDVKYNTDSIINPEDMDLAVIYRFYLNTFGNIAYFKETGNMINFGILSGMYMNPENKFATVEFIDSNGDFASYECYNSMEEDDFYSHIVGYDTYYDGQTVTKADVADNIQNMAFRYTIMPDGKVSFKTGYEARGGANLVYNAVGNRLDMYKMDKDATKIFYLGDYLNGSSESATIMRPYNLVENALYSAYVYDKNSEDNYRFCIVTDEAKITCNTNIAVVVTEPEDVSFDDESYAVAAVLKEGREINIWLEGASDEYNISQGDIIVYETNSYGIVSELEVAMCIESDYTALFDNRMPKFSSAIKTIDANNNWKWYTESCNVKAYFGPVYKKSGNNLELFTRSENGMSNIYDDVEVFNIKYANKYVYDYASTPGYRVAATSLEGYIPSSLYDSAIDDMSGELLDWNLVNEYSINPCFAFIKEMDGDVTDIVLFLPAD